MVIVMLKLYVPKLEDYWYEEKILKDPNTMSYNAGYEVSYYGYHYDTGCIDFPKDKWKEKFCKRQNRNVYFAYVIDLEINEFIGYCNYQYNEKDNKNGIKELYDSFEVNRGNTLKIFESVGFKIVNELTWKKFGKEVTGVEVKIEL